MGISIANPSYDKVYTAYAWRYNSIFLNMTQGEGVEDTGVVWNDDGTINQQATSQLSVTADHVKVPRFQLRDDRGILDLTDCQVVLAVKRHKGAEDLLACYTVGDASDGTIACPITRSVTANEGRGLGEIRVLSHNAVIKFYGIHFNIYKGVSDLAAEQSTQFAALVSALQKIALVNPDGSNTVDMDTEVTENGTNPVASGVLYDFVYSVFNDGSKVSYVTNATVDNATENGKVYYTTVGSSKALIVPVSGDSSQVQFRLDRDGKIYARRRSRSSTTVDFPSWGIFEQIGWTSAEIGAMIDSLVDSTLSVQGKAAEAKATGNEIKADAALVAGESLITSSLLEPYNATFTNVEYTTTANKSLRADGTIIDYNAGGVSNVVVLTPDTLYECNCAGIGGGGAYFFLYDKNDNISAIYPTIDTDSKNFVFKASDKFKKIQFNVRGSGCYLRAITLNGLEVKNNFIKFTNHILDTVDYTRLNISFIESRSINNKGEVVEYPHGGTTWTVSNEIDISQYDYLKINARTGWGDAFFAIYDENHNPIYVEVSPSSGASVFNDNVILPENAHYLVISKCGQEFDAYVSYPVFEAPTKKTQTITAQSTHDQIPTALAVYNYAAPKVAVNNINTEIQHIEDSLRDKLEESDVEEILADTDFEEKSNRVDTIGGNSRTPDNNHYPTEKAVYDYAASKASYTYLNNQYTQLANDVAQLPDTSQVNTMIDALVDSTLSVQGKAAEAKATGNEIKADAALVAGESLITPSLLEPYNATFTNVEYTTTEHKMLTIDGTIVDYGVGSVSNIIQLNIDTLYECNCGGIGGGGAHFFLYDSENNISAIYPALTTSFKKFIFKATENFNKIQFNIRGSGCYLRAITLNGLEVENNFLELENNFIELTNHILDTVDYTRLNISFIESKCIRNDGVVTDYPNGGTTWTVSNEIDISQYDYLKINARTGYGNAYFAVYDENHNPIYVEVSPSSGIGVFNDNVILPENAHYLVISKCGTDFDAYVSYPVFEAPTKKSQTITSQSTHDQIPTAKAVYDYAAEAKATGNEIKADAALVAGESLITASLLEPYNATFTDVEYTTTANKSLMADGTIVDYNAGGVSNVVVLTPDTLYECNCAGIGGGGAYFFLYDKNDNITAIYPAIDTDSKNFVFKASDKFKKIQFNVRGSGCYLRAITLNGLEVENNFIELTNHILDTVDYTRLNISFIESKCIRNDGVVTDYPNGGTTWTVSNEIDISQYDYLKINARTGYGDAYFAVYDENHNPIYVEVSPSSGIGIFNDYVILPENAHYLVISKLGTTFDAYASYPVFEAPTKKWEGKKWVCIGDSLTEANSATSKHYFDYIADETGITTANYGIGGTGYANPSGTAGNFTARMASVPTDADVYTIFGSFNDYAYSINNDIPIGTPEDSGTSTICGYINSAFDALFARVPLANLGVVAPCPWVSVNSVTGTTSKTFAENYVSALRQCCERKSIPFLDLYHGSGLRPWDSNFRDLTYTKDTLHGVHPDETGHAILAPKFSAFLESLLTCYGIIEE